MGRNSRTRRRVAAAGVGTSIEFAELLDPVSGPAASAVPVADAIDTHTEPAVDTVEVADLVTEPVPAAVSRFADSGLDDDRLPLHDTKKRSRRH